MTPSPENNPSQGPRHLYPDRSLQLCYRRKMKDAHTRNSDMVTEYRVLKTIFAAGVLGKDAENQIRKLEYMANHDELTGLYNEGYFMNIMDQYSQDNRKMPLAIIALDVNFLKIVNDTLGHQVGNSLLLALARLMQGSVRLNDPVCRTGGDEHHIVLPNIEQASLERIIETLQEKATTFKIDGIPLSFGLGKAMMSNAKSKLVTELLKVADEEMYLNKIRFKEQYPDLIIKCFIEKLKEKSPEASEHAQRVADLSLSLGKAVRLTQDELITLSELCLLHNIGI